MSASRSVAAYLPFLRRYARALSGSQPAGDAYVGATLETVAAEPAVLDGTSSLRVGLYRVFSKIWNSVSVNGIADPSGKPLPGEMRLSKMSPRPRQAFLLIALEGFSEAAAAEVLEVDVPALRQLIEEAGHELASEIATEVMIIEDEPLIAMDLRGLIEKLGHKVTGVARTHAEAITLSKAKYPGLILADIQLADGSSGLDAVNELLRAFEVPVIFITAYPERFLTGERPEPAFLIAKPFEPGTVSAVVSQALFFERNARRAPRRAAS